jgi:hypothetical protein
MLSVRIALHVSGAFGVRAAVAAAEGSKVHGYTAASAVNRLTHLNHLSKNTPPFQYLEGRENPVDLREHLVGRVISPVAPEHTNGRCRRTSRTLVPTAMGAFRTDCFGPTEEESCRSHLRPLPTCRSLLSYPVRKVSAVAPNRMP